MVLVVVVVVNVALLDLAEVQVFGLALVIME
jgi:hypothetical protein